MRNIRFETLAPIVPSDPNRVDVALFVGLVGRRSQTLDAPLATWLAERGWYRPAPDEQPREAPSRADLEALLDVPVPIEDWETFDHLFAWDERPVAAGASPVEGGATADCYLATAVRCFFAEGGQRCYVVRVAEPPPVLAPRPTREALTAKLLPGTGSGGVRVTASPDDRRSWRGIAHLYGLPDVSLVVLPDLPDLLGIDRPSLDATPPAPPGPSEDFVMCSHGEESASPPDLTARRLRAPACDQEGFTTWHRLMGAAVDVVARHVREAQVLAAVPHAADTLDLPPQAHADLLAFLRGSGLVESAFLQLTYPWLVTRGSGRLPAGLEPPDGTLAGLVARNAITRGTFRSATRLRPSDAYDFFPKLPTADRDDALESRVCRFGATPAGLALLSDVTTSADPAYRQAGISRLVGCILRAARLVGEDLTFGANGPRLWGDVVTALDDLMRGLWQLGALRGNTAEEAYTVRCDRSTMSQADLDAGRVLAEISFDAALGIDRITVILTLNDGGHVSLAPARAA